MAEQELPNSLQCYVIPSEPLPLILPVECVAEVAPDPEIEPMADAPAKWMIGYTTWQNQRLPLMSFSALQNPTSDDVPNLAPYLVVLNPVAEAARKAYTGLVCFGDVEQVSVDQNVVVASTPDFVDRRYIEAVIDFDGRQCMVPKLSAISVAFSYF